MELFLIILLCLVLNSLLAAFEMAFVSVSRRELQPLAADGSKMAQWVLDRRADPERTLSVIQIGITLVALLAATVGGMGAATNFQPYFIREWGMTPMTAELLSILTIVLPLSYLNVVVGELTPKSLALRGPLKIVLKGAPWIAFADKILSPMVTFLEWSTKKVLQLFFPRSRRRAAGGKTTIEIGSLTPSHQRAVVNLVSIEGRQVQDVMVPWREVTHAQESNSMEEIVPVVFASGHTRLPVVKEEEVVGTLNTKEFLGLREAGALSWTQIIHPTMTILNTDYLLPVLRTMQSQHIHMAVVVSGQGHTLGIVTMEDIIEEFLGDIYDEDDESRIHKIFADRLKSQRRPYRDDELKF